MIDKIESLITKYFQDYFFLTYPACTTAEFRPERRIVNNSHYEITIWLILNHSTLNESIALDRWIRNIGQPSDSLTPSTVFVRELIKKIILTYRSESIDSRCYISGITTFDHLKKRGIQAIIRTFGKIQVNPKRTIE